MRLTTSTLDGVLVITVEGPVEIDVGNADDFKAAAIEAAGDSPRVVLDCAGVEYFDSAGMGALLSLQKHVVLARGRLSLCGVNRACQEVFRMVGLDSVFTWHPTADAAAGVLRH